MIYIAHPRPAGAGIRPRDPRPRTNGEGKGTERASAAGDHHVGRADDIASGLRTWAW